VTRANRFLIPVLSSVVALLACDVEPRSKNIAEPDSATLVLQSSMGEDMAASADHQFSWIVAMLVTEDEKLWVVDGFNGATPQVRMYDSDGKFLRRVGNVGSGPGEYRNPNALAALADGRVVLRDQHLADRLTVYTSAGTVDTTWSLEGRYVPVGRGVRMMVDTSGLLWIYIASRQRPDLDRNQAYLRVRNGAIIDTVRLPPLPELPREGVRVEERLPSGGLSVRGADAPYQAQAVWALDRRGRFAIARTDEYRIEMMPAPGAGAASTTSFVSREVPAVSISEEQRAAERAGLVTIMDKMGLPTHRVPEIPSFKPLLKQLYFASDGQLLVSVSMPSRFMNGKWMESTAYDVFDQDARFRGRLHIPEGFTMGYLKGDKLWGVYRDQDGVESIRRYNIKWPE
jgi:hypothetical protein